MTLHTTDDKSSISTSLLSLIVHKPHTERVASIAKVVDLYNNEDKPSKRSLRALAEHLGELDRPYQVQGLDFSRTQLDTLIKIRDQGLPIEFETFGPYLIDYVHNDGVMELSNLIPEDELGISLASAIRQYLPSARVISLYDEYNIRKGNLHVAEDNMQFTNDNIQNFRNSLIALLQDTSIIPKDAIDRKDFLLIPESSKIKDAEHLVERLSALGNIVQNNNEIFFANDHAENPLYRRVQLRSKHGRWLCEALDAAAFLRPENQKITHLVALPDCMKAQQDKVWEILRVLTISSDNYHNIFYDPNMSPYDARTIITEAFRMAEILAKVQ